MKIEYEVINEPIKFSTGGTVEHDGHTHTFWYETDLGGDTDFELNEYANDDKLRCDVGDLAEEVEDAAREVSND